MFRSILKRYGLLIFLLALTIFSILARAWVAEDAYITFRHVDNLFAGNGLTFNKGERVEGFTHPLWAGLLILLRLASVPLHTGVIFLGLALTIAGMALLIQAHGLRSPEKTILLLPLLLIPHDGFRDFTTSGLEFSLTFFLLAVFFRKSGDRLFDQPVESGTILALLYLTRPETALLGIYYGIFFAFHFIRRPSRIFLFLLPFLVLDGGYQAFRWFYYNDIFPTTYYAKSGGDANVMQGLRYLGHTLLYSPLLLPALAGLALILWRTRRQVPSGLYRDLGAAGLLAVYIIRIGGDFMAYRLLLPALVVLLICAQRLLNQVSGSWKPIFNLGINGVLLATAGWLLFFADGHTPVKWLIADERRAYTPPGQGFLSRLREVDNLWYKRGIHYGKLQSCLESDPFILTNSTVDAKCAAPPGFGLGFFSVAAGTNTTVIDEQGLTDRRVAHKKMGHRFRPGHERSLSIEEVIDRGAIFCSTGYAPYDDAMKTPFGVLLTLNREFLFKLGPESYAQHVAALRQLKQQAVGDTSEAVTRFRSLLMQMEKRSGTRIENLPLIAPHGYEKFSSCWSDADV